MLRLFARLSLVLALCLPAVGWAQAEPDDDAGEAQIRARYLLMDARGRAVSNEDFIGRFQLIAFGFTSCPAICPSTLATMSLVMRQLGERAALVQPLFITIDPERDTAAVLDAYVRNFDERIIGLTGSPQLIARAAESFRVTYRKYVEPGAAPGDYTMDHSVGMYLVGPDGRFLTRYPHAAPPEEIAERLQARIAAYDNDPRVLRAQRARH